MQTVNFKCGHCGNLMAVSADYLGKQVRCPHCQKVVVAPPASAAPPVPASPPPPMVPLSGAAPDNGETALLPPPREDVASIFNEQEHTENLFNVPNHPRLEIPESAMDTTLALNANAAPPGPSLDKTVEFVPSAPTSAGAQTAALDETLASGPEIPAWMSESSPTAAPDHHVEGLPAPAPVRAPRGSSLGLTLFITMVFMPLILYSVLATILAVLFYLRTQETPPIPDPREQLQDIEGDHPGSKKRTVARLLQTDMEFATRPLPPQLRIKLGETITLGDVQVKAERVEWAVVRIKTASYPKAEPRQALVLHLHVKNVSENTQFYPMDGLFDRRWADKEKGKGFTYPPLTLLLAGDKLRFVGGPAEWNLGPQKKSDNTTPLRYKVLGNKYDEELKPGEGLDTFVCTDGPDPNSASDPGWAKIKELLEYKGPLVWHVHIRRGLVRWKERDLPATAVFGVEFTDADITGMPQ